MLAISEAEWSSWRSSFLETLHAAANCHGDECIRDARSTLEASIASLDHRLHQGAETEDCVEELRSDQQADGPDIRDGRIKRGCDAETQVYCVKSVYFSKYMLLFLRERLSNRQLTRRLGELGDAAMSLAWDLLSLVARVARFTPRTSRLAPRVPKREPHRAVQSESDSVGARCAASNGNHEPHYPREPVPAPPPQCSDVACNPVTNIVRLLRAPSAAVVLSVLRVWRKRQEQELADEGLLFFPSMDEYAQQTRRSREGEMSVELPSTSLVPLVNTDGTVIAPLSRSMSVSTKGSGTRRGSSGMHLSCSSQQLLRDLIEVPIGTARKPAPFNASVGDVTDYCIGDERGRCATAAPPSGPLEGGQEPSVGYDSSMANSKMCLTETATSAAAASSRDTAGESPSASAGNTYGFSPFICLRCRQDARQFFQIDASTRQVRKVAFQKHPCRLTKSSLDGSDEPLNILQHRSFGGEFAGREGHLPSTVEGKNLPVPVTPSSSQQETVASQSRSRDSQAASTVSCALAPQPPSRRLGPKSGGSYAGHKSMCKRPQAEVNDKRFSSHAYTMPQCDNKASTGSAITRKPALGPKREPLTSQRHPRTTSVRRKPSDDNAMLRGLLSAQAVGQSGQ